MVMYTKKIYALKNKSEDNVQHYGFIISIDDKPMVRQWHMPKVGGFVFMTETEVDECADEMMDEFNNQKDLPFKKSIRDLK